MPRKSFWLAGVALVLGCSQTPIEVGSYVADTDSAWTDEKSCAAGPQLPIVGTWVGSSDVQRGPSGSKAVRLVISHANAKNVCGKLTLGREAPPWPAVIDPNAPYPPELAQFPPSSFMDFLQQLEGVPQTITRARVELPIVSFRASYGQWRDWCERQTPYQCEDVPSEQYYCVRTSGSGGLIPRVQPSGSTCVTRYGGEMHTVDCGKAMLCLDGPCTCTATGCSATSFWGGEYQLEFHDDVAVGEGMSLTRAE